MNERIEEKWKDYVEGNPVFRADLPPQFICDILSHHQATLEGIEKLIDYTVHEPSCIRARFSAGRPTKGGGYEQEFAGKWYETRPIDKTPKCNCGLSDTLSIINSHMK